MTNAVSHYQFRTDAADNVARGESVQNPLNKNEEGTGIPKDYQTTIDKQTSALREKDRESEPSEVTEISKLVLDKEGTHLTYFTQKQDVIFIKNLFVSVEHNWEMIVSRYTERIRALDYGYQEAKELYDWDFMMEWLGDGMIHLE